MSAQEIRAGLVADFGEIRNFIEKNAEHIRKSVQTNVLKRIQTLIGMITEDKEHVHEHFEAIHELFPPEMAIALINSVLISRNDFGDASNVEAICNSFAQQYNIPIPPK